MVAPTRWTGRPGHQAWTDGANWSAGVPVATQVALFNRAGLQIDLGTPGGAAVVAGKIDVSAGSVRFMGGREVAIDPPYHAGTRDNVGLRVNGATLTIAAGALLLRQHDVEVGDQSSATIEIQGTLTDFRATIGSLNFASTAESKAIVSGPGALWQNAGVGSDLVVGGYGGAATLEVRDGGHVGTGGPVDGSNANRTLIYNVAGQASALVTDSGSELAAGGLSVGVNNYPGALAIANGARVRDYFGSIGGQGTLTVAGRGSAWINEMKATITGAYFEGRVSVTDHGRVDFGTFGLTSMGVLALDATATIEGSSILLADGSLSAIATPGAAASTVIVSQAINLGYNPDRIGTHPGDRVGSADGVTLELTGRIAQSEGFGLFAVAGGHVKLDNPGSGFFYKDLRGGVLELSTTGAAGTGRVQFVNPREGGVTASTIQIDLGVTLANTITGLGVLAQDAIDLRGIGFGAAISLAYAPSSASGGVLTVSNGVNQATLNLDYGSYTQVGFVAADDGKGGTAIFYHTP